MYTNTKFLSDSQVRARFARQEVSVCFLKAFQVISQAIWDQALVCLQCAAMSFDFVSYMAPVATAYAGMIIQIFQLQHQYFCSCCFQSLTLLSLSHMEFSLCLPITQLEWCICTLSLNAASYDFFLAGVAGSAVWGGPSAALSLLD